MDREAAAVIILFFVVCSAFMALDLSLRLPLINARTATKLFTFQTESQKLSGTVSVLRLR